MTLGNGAASVAAVPPAADREARGAPWELPWGWEWIPLGDLCHLVNGRAFKPSEWSDVGLPIVRIQNLNDPSKPFNYFNGEPSPKHLVNDRDVLISWSGTPGTSFGAFLWNRGRALLNQHIYRADLDHERSEPLYLVHAVNVRLDEMIRRAHGGVGLGHITKGELERVRLPIPFPQEPERSLDVQRRIVARIEALLAEMKEARALAEDIRSDTDRVMDAAVEEAMSQLGPGRQALIEVLDGKPRNGWSPQCDNDPAGAPVLKLGAVLGFRFNPGAIKYTNIKVDRKAHYWLNPGDILISRSNTPDLVGHAAIYGGEPHPCIYPDLLVRMRVRTDAADAQFVVYWLRSREAREYVAAHASGASSTMKKITQGDVCELPFPYVCVELQRAIVAQLDTVQTEVNEMCRLQAHDAELLDQVEQAILERAFRGEL
ncbi:MAG: restriction endonuclease subunit S [Deltaproteobacteria bacterium]|nr:restriction endonuclease subunit S [Deltaproteobacteria bacterium]